MTLAAPNPHKLHITECARCGIKRQANVSRPGVLCRDCRAVLTTKEMGAWNT